MNIQEDPTRSNLASAMLNSKIRPRAIVGTALKFFIPVLRITSPGRTRSRFFVPHLHKLFAVSVRTLNIRKTMRNTLSLKFDHNKANHCREKSLWEWHIFQSLSEQIRAFFLRCFKISCWWQILCSSSKREFWKLERLLSLIRVNSGFNKFSLRLSRFLLKANRTNRRNVIRE